MARLLVTGGAGFIGANFVHYWCEHHPGDRLIVLDALTYSGNPANLASVRNCAQLSFVHGDICDSALIERLLRAERLDTIVHFAAESHVDRSIEDPDVFVQTNVVGTHSLLRAARAVWLGKDRLDQHRFHHISTDEVYGSLAADDPAFTETTPHAPNSPYAASKAAADHMVRAYQQTYGLHTTTSNCANNYGRFHFPEKLIPLAITNILQGKPLPIYGDGLNIRDWLHVVDHCRGIEAILTSGIPGEVYNVGGGSECTNLQLVNMLCAIADELFHAQPELRSRYPSCPASRGEHTAALLTFVKDRPGHDRRYATDSSKIRTRLGFQPTVPLQAGLRDTFQWYLDNETWWRDVLEGRYRNGSAAQRLPALATQ
jgi:dTDP-glucose 4,6-dehydratase